MAAPVHFISKIIINGLWDKYDLEWNLNPDVNILSGVNGSGKSTVLQCVYSLLQGHLDDTPPSRHIDKIQRLRITFDNDEAWIERILEKKNVEDIQDFLAKNKLLTPEVEADYWQGKKMQVLAFDRVSAILTNEGILVFVDLIHVLDNDFNTTETIQKLKEDGVHTELDLQIALLQKEYLNFQVNLSKEVEQILTHNGANAASEAREVRKTFNRFLDILDTLFASSEKKVHRASNEITFQSGDKILSAYQLSSGEKHLLVILLTVLLQHQKPAILMLDEPELSLHFDWERQCIGFLRELNPNAQLIIATHSPAIIMDGWLDKVTDMHDILKPKAHDIVVKAG
ncbi:MAG: ATP-binding protein [Candidatus Kapabacteria bacterium]|nr:ATP-binding protein [Candidatus Kapabacteria bacterium]